MSSPSKKKDQNEVHAIQDLLQCGSSSAYLQKKAFYKTWTFDRSSTKCRGEIVYQTMHCSNRKIGKALRHKLVEWIMKNTNVREYPIARDILFITDAESRVKRRVPKLVFERSMRQLHNYIIASQDY